MNEACQDRSYRLNLKNSSQQSNNHEFTCQQRAYLLLYVTGTTSHQDRAKRIFEFTCYKYIIRSKPCIHSTCMPVPCQMTLNFQAQSEQANFLVVNLFHQPIDEISLIPFSFSLRSNLHVPPFLFPFLENNSVSAFSRNTRDYTSLSHYDLINSLWQPFQGRMIIIYILIISGSISK